MKLGRPCGDFPWETYNQERPPIKPAFKPVVIAALAGLCLTACASGPYYGHGPGPGPVAYDAYYDDFYGPFDDGYWGPDGGFYYSTGPDHHFVRDSGNHFRRQAGGSGFHGVHFHGGAGHPGGGGGEHHGPG